MASDYYAPNQQVVRADGSGPAEQGKGGSKRRGRPPKAEAAKREEAQPQPQEEEAK